MDVFQKIKLVFGSQSALARKLDLEPMTVSQWKRRGNIPAERCAEIEEASGGAISRAECNPKVFGKVA